jgi:hypothetical protein
MESKGSLVTGILLSLAGALVGALVWFGVAWATNYEIGWIAWGVGVLAGAGMLVGYRQTDTIAGILAAVISLVGILGAKIMVFAHALSQIDPEFRKMADSMGIQIGTMSDFFESSFGPIDGLFILLAVASAYKIGTTGWKNE